MTDDIDKRLISRISDRGERKDFPRVVPLELVVRTPGELVPADLPDDAGGRKLRELPPLDPKAPLLGPFLFEWQYNVASTYIGAFHDWLSLYEDRLREVCPKHFRYINTFEAVFGSSWQSPRGRYRTLWQHADLAGILHLRYGKKQQKACKNDKEKEELKAREDEFLKLLAELISFQDIDSPARSTRLYQLVTKKQIAV